MENSKTALASPILSVSVVIPVYNGVKFIHDVLEHLLAQDYADGELEIIVVDNASTDGTVELIKKYPVVLLHCSVKGPSAARNVGAMQAKGDLLIFIDADCLAFENFVSKHVEAHKNYSQKSNHLGIIGGAIVGYNTNFWSLCDDFCCWNECHPKLKPRKIRHYWPSANISLKKNVFLEIGGFNEELMTGEDVEFSKRVRKSGREIYFEPTPVLAHINRVTLSDVLKRIQAWAKIDSSHFKHGIAKREKRLPIIVEAIGGSTIILYMSIYRSILAGRFHVFFVIPFLVLNASIFGFMWAKAHYRAELSMKQEEKTK